MAIIRHVLTRIATVLGFLPKPVSTAEQFLPMLQKQHHSLKYAVWLTIVGVILYTLSTLLVEPRRLDQFLATFFGVMVIIMTDIARMQVQMILTWATRTFDVLKVAEGQHREIQALHDITGLLKLLDDVREQGWMYSIGFMNTHNHTGPTAFFWRPDVVVADGKIESRAYVGKGETIEQAVQNAIATMRAANQ